ncbi:hypothetical protein JM658_02850 [Joostella atrarenae]|uniref:PKD domain-containing protein n=1 Tax=Joostella atrarenae TaxID=679257 RepID=A0ABS9IZZ1_9FLAO|nr:hypothetical protein [Joostella atrarenae]MCF8713753.1 hypothetical protein [Joostella atrarenae]
MVFKNIFNRKTLVAAIAVSAIISSCQPEEINEGNGLSDPNVDASFMITEIEGESNVFLFEAQTENVISSKWDFGAGLLPGKMTEEVFFPDAGTYEIVHQAIGRGGLTGTVTQELVVETSDPVAGNIVLGGTFETSEDHSNWNTLKISDSGSEWVFNEGSATIFSTEQWSQTGIYQAIEVEKDKEYSIDMLVSGEANGDTWLEVYAGTSVPVEGQAYEDTKIMGISTWDGCGTAKFSGKLSNVGCIENTQTKTVSNKVTFAESGTIYLLIRSGGGSMNPAGITISNVEMRGS